MTCRFCGFNLPEPKAAMRTLGRIAESMIGLPDYDYYVAHRLAQHPDQPIMTRPQFICERQDRRYGGGPGGTFKCC